MIFDSTLIEEDYDFILLFDNELINEAAFKFNGKHDKNKFKDATKCGIGNIRIRNKYESSNITNERNHGLSLKVTFDKDNVDIEIPIDRKTGDIIRKPNDSLNNIPMKKINYIQNFIYANIDDIVGYYQTNNDTELNIFKNNILNNSVGRSFKKKG